MSRTSKAKVELDANAESPRTRRLKSLVEDRDWSGYLTLDNADAVAERIRSMIGGGQRYTWVAVNEAFGWRPEVRTGQVAETIRNATNMMDGHTYAHVSVLDTYGSWGLDTEAADEQAAREGRERDRVYLSFTHRQLTVEHYAPAGNHMYWVVALEGLKGS